MGENLFDDDSSTISTSTVKKLEKRQDFIKYAEEVGA